ncbi:hypothetical protein [Parapedobacter sp. 2B3]|uniref:hypothetical protein n=1 Tax=Parapedobacter sp. 2B3 TaxID=3342381 RepID=UPI0035B5C7B2
MILLSDLTTGDKIQIIAQFVTLTAALIGAIIAARTSLKVLSIQRDDIKRNFCLELKKQLDLPEMFACRYEAWRKLDEGKFDSITTVHDLLHSTDYDNKVSIVLHFFESLEYYCERNMVDTELAYKLFGRVYKMWYDRLIKKLTLDEKSQSYTNWFNNLTSLGKRFEEISAQQQGSR